MSHQADDVRTRRRQWAALGGRHDRLVRAMQLALPVIVGALAAVMLFAPFSNHGQISFLVAKDAIEVAAQRIMVSRAMYRGSDNRGRAFAIAADSAIQRSAADPIVRMTGVDAQVTMAEGPATLSALAGRYDPTRDILIVDGPLRFATSDGYQLDTRDVTINLRDRTAASSRPVTGATRIGRFSANSMAVDLQARTVSLRGNVHLRMTQGLR